MTEKQQALFKARQERNRAWEHAHLDLLLSQRLGWVQKHFRKWWERHRN